MQSTVDESTVDESTATSVPTYIDESTIDSLLTYQGHAARCMAIALGFHDEKLTREALARVTVDDLALARKIIRDAHAAKSRDPEIEWEVYRLYQAREKLYPRFDIDELRNAAKKYAKLPMMAYRRSQEFCLDYQEQLSRFQGTPAEADRLRLGLLAIVTGVATELPAARPEQKSLSLEQIQANGIKLAAASLRARLEQGRMHFIAAGMTEGEFDSLLEKRMQESFAEPEAASV